VTPALGSQRFEPAGPLRGRLRVPADKSITHRALLVGAVCDAPALVERPLWAGDTLATAAALRALGVSVESGEGGEATVVHGAGLRGLRQPAGALDARNSGTTLRLLAGLLAGQHGTFVLDGDESLRRRPMDRVVEPLRLMGVAVHARDGRYPPLEIHGGDVLAVDYELPVASAQVKSCVLLAGLHTRGVTTVIERTPSRDHTERLLRAAGAQVTVAGGRIALKGQPRLRLERVAVPGDPSSAAFLVAAAALVAGSDIEIGGIGLNPTRLGFFEVLRRMGGRVEWTVEGGLDEAPDGPCGEPWGTMRVRRTQLHGVRVAPAEVPLLIDEVPLVALLASAAEGETVVEGVGELRVKESDRLAATAELLGGLGARIEIAGDAIRVTPSRLVGGVVDSRGDHRLALLGAVAGLAAQGGVTVNGFDAADVSFPRFQQTLREVLAP
jgi:3-phosphoshikimate 1-carboxyvinyltransferase